MRSFGSLLICCEERSNVLARAARHAWTRLALHAMNEARWSDVKFWAEQKKQGALHDSYYEAPHFHFVPCFMLRSEQAGLKTLERIVLEVNGASLLFA